MGTLHRTARQAATGPRPWVLLLPRPIRGMLLGLLAASVLGPAQVMSQQEGQGRAKQHAVVGPRQEQTTQEDERAAGLVARRPALPNLRIVRVDVTPHPVPAGHSARVDVVIHNDAMFPAGGRVVIRALHDRPAPLPVPGSRERVFIAADALETVSFVIAEVRAECSPYELVVAVDVDNDIEESREEDNVAARRLVGCPEAAGEEVWDGIDNDCDGEIDEEVWPDDRRERLLRMQAEQRRALRQLLPLVFGVAEPVAPYSVRYGVRLRASTGDYVTAERGGGGAVKADRQVAGAWQELTLIDHDGGDLVSGDTVSLRAPDGVHWLAAPGGGGGGLHGRSGEYGRARLFVLLRAGGRGTVTSGDRIHLKTSSGHFVVAEGGGGGGVNANRRQPGPWETFVLEIPAEDARAESP